MLLRWRVAVFFLRRLSRHQPLFSHPFAFYALVALAIPARELLRVQSAAAH